METFIPEKAYWVAASFFARGGTLRRLLNGFDSGQAMWQAPEEAFAALGLHRDTIHRIMNERSRRDPLSDLSACHQHGVAIVTIGDADYPSLLREAADAPGLLFYRGTLPRAEAVSLALVGTRRVSTYGTSVAMKFARAFARAGCVVVSGLARGVDGLAHEAAVDCGGITVAVIGSGLDRSSLYPREHWRLSEAIVEHGGAIISEYPPGIGPEQHHFPERNRIIAGLCRAVLVVEAPEKSGALLTAYQALEENREVFAVPGSIFEKNSVGVHRLIQRGAQLVTEPEEVLGALGLVVEKTSAPSAALTSLEQTVLEAISESPRGFDALVGACSLSPSDLATTLSLLELKGLIKDLGGKRYVLVV